VWAAAVVKALIWVTSAPMAGSHGERESYGW
jgi:hypothetical protein